MALELLLMKKHLRLRSLQVLLRLSLNDDGNLGAGNKGLKGFGEGNKGFHLRLDSSKKRVGFVVVMVAIKDEMKLRNIN